MGLKLRIRDPEQWLEDCPDRVYENWKAFSGVEPFGDERELLTRAVSLLYVLCFLQAKPEQVIAESDNIMQRLMPSNWIGQTPKLTPEQEMANVEKLLASRHG